MALFKSRADTIADKLTEAKAAVLAADEALRAISLEAALSPDPFFAEPHFEALRRAQGRVDMFEHALDQLASEKRQKEAVAKAALRQSQVNAVAQHKGRMVKAAGEFTKMASWLIETFDLMVREGETIKRLLPQGDDAFTRAVSYRNLLRVCTAEMARLGGGQDIPGSRATAPGCKPEQPIGFHPKTMPALTDSLGGQLERLYAQLTGKVPPPPITPAVAEEAPPTVAEDSIAAATAQEAPEVQSDREPSYPLPAAVPDGKNSPRVRVLLDDGTVTTAAELGEATIVPPPGVVEHADG